MYLRSKLGDEAFKKGSGTYPRSELRYLDEQEDGLYEFGVSVFNTSVSKDFDYSFYQLFGSSPLLMIRFRSGNLQQVVFDGKPKISIIKSLPNRCVVKCGKGGFVECDGVRSEGRIRCNDKLHFKVGIYSQQMDPIGTECIWYSGLYFNKLNGTVS